VVLAITGLAHSFGEHVVLDDVNLSLRRGQVCAVVGPNGAGKTTLLRCVAGTLKPDAGTIRLLGRTLDETDPGIRADVACVLDDADFFPDLSAAEHLELMAYAFGTPDARARVNRVLEQLGLEGVRDQIPPTLSSGQRRRLALASCFVRPRKLLVLDEPEQRLDQAGRAWLAEQLRAEKEAGIAVMMASHDPELVAAVTDLELALELA
jgi:heme ABC exporter ATP-binding subunit CcmA